MLRCFSRLVLLSAVILPFLMSFFLFFKMIKSNYIISLNLFKIGQGSRLTLKSFLFHGSLVMILLTEINFVEIQAVDTDSTFYHFHSFCSRLLLLFCAQKGRMHPNYRNFIIISIAIKCYFKRLIWNIFLSDPLGRHPCTIFRKAVKMYFKCVLRSFYLIQIQNLTFQ